MASPRDSFRERTRGRWRGILPQLGVPLRFMNGKHQACPSCGGKDRARFDDRDGTGSYFCSRCGPGYGADLVMAVNGWDFKQAAAEIEKLIGAMPLDPPKRENTIDDQRSALRKVWMSSAPLSEDTPAGLWLVKRTGFSVLSKALRSHPHLRYHDEHPSYHPAMIALIEAHDGRPVTLHRTYLTKDGDKAQVPSPRRLMPGSLEDGCAVRLFNHGEALGIAEGIETAIAASLIFDLPVWSAINDNLLSKWIPPEGVREVVVFGDNDANYAGQAASFALARRLTDKGYRVYIQIPGKAGMDWNDVLLNCNTTGCAWTLAQMQTA